MLMSSFDRWKYGVFSVHLTAFVSIKQSLILKDTRNLMNAPDYCECTSGIGCVITKKDILRIKFEVSLQQLKINKVMH